MAWTKKGHSPSSHPRHRITVRSSQRSVLLTKTFAIVLFRRIHFLSVKTSHYFQVISEPLNLPSGQPGQFEQNTNLARGIPTGIATVTPLPPHHKLEGRPRTCTSSIFGTYLKDSLLGRSASTTGQVGRAAANSQLYQENPGLYFPTFKNHLWQRN